jgi:hypothetical protein
LRRTLATILLILFSTMTALYPSVASGKEGKLQKFEKEFDKQEPKRYHRDPGQSDYYYESSSVSGAEVATSTAMSMLYSFFLMGLMSGGATSSRELYQQLKDSESPALPTIKVDLSYQWLTDNINGAIGRIEAGYLMFGADFEYIRYFEKSAPDLSFLSGHVLLRTLFARFIGVNLALGVKSIWGARKRTGFEVGFPFYVYFNNYLILDFLPYVAFISNKRVYDMAAGFSFKYKVVGVRAAYRLINNEGQTLHGPQVGVFIQW